MTALVELLGTLLCLIGQVTFEGLRVVFLIVMAIFSPSYRERLAERWNRPGWSWLFMVLVGVVNGSFLILALCFWGFWLTGRKDTSATDHRPSRDGITIPLLQEGEEPERTSKLDKFIRVAGDRIQRKLAERERQRANGVDPAVPVPPPADGQ